MPKIDVNEQLFFNLLGKKYDYSPEFEHLLSSAKAELDETPSAATPQDERIIKIELNDTKDRKSGSAGMPSPTCGQQRGLLAFCVCTQEELQTKLGIKHFYRH